MSMSTYLYGIKPADEKFMQMKAIFDACEVAGIYPPVEVIEFFNGESPDTNGVIVELPNECITYFSENGSAGYYIDVRKLPDDVKIIQFKNSW